MIELDDKDLRRAMNLLGRAFNADKANRTIKRSVSKRLRGIMAPMVADRRARVMRLPSKGHSQPGGSMRAAIAKKITANTRWSGKNTGISIVQRARGMPRDFQMAGRAFNREEGWNPKTLGGESQRQQITPAQWFDGADTKDGMRARREITAALEEVAGTMASEIRRIR